MTQPENKELYDLYDNDIEETTDSKPTEETTDSKPTEEADDKDYINYYDDDDINQLL